MTATVRAACISVCLFAVGTAAVHLEIENVRRGVRIRRLLKEEDASLERLRRLEIRYSRMTSPDVLSKRFEEDFEPGGGGSPAPVPPGAR